MSLAELGDTRRPGVVYESVMFCYKKARHGKFPLNMTDPIVKHLDRLNDGLVSVESAKWGGGEVHPPGVPVKAVGYFCAGIRSSIRSNTG